MRLLVSSLLFIALSTSFLTSQEQRGPSTPEERTRFVAITDKLQESPLDSNLRKEREWAILWLIQVPDVHASVCTSVLGSAFKSKYKYSSEITVQLTLASGKYSVEHPGNDIDKNAQYLAAVQSTLAAYESILKQKPDAHSKALDDLIKARSEGKLEETVKDSAKNCK